MKIRCGFVSNSSSSSFVVIGDTGKKQVPSWANDTYVYIDGKLGVTEFGWDVTEYKEVLDKINFAYIQARDVKRQDWIDMLENIIKKNTTVRCIDWNLPYDLEHIGKFAMAYIDHQSSSVEGQNIEIFDSEENLENFIFNSASYIQGGNDNI